jgi:predicted transcriptional regulator
MKELTRAEEEIMQILWQLERGFVKDIIEKIPEPKPAYTTVSTVIRILEQKGFVGHTAYGKTHEYHPLMSKDEYSHLALQKHINSYFGGSFKNLFSFFAKKENINLHEYDELLKKMQENEGISDSDGQ